MESTFAAMAVSEIAMFGRPDAFAPIAVLLTVVDLPSGDLRQALLAQLATAANEGTEIYAALFELSDPELVAALVKLGKKAHLGAR